MNLLERELQEARLIELDIEIARNQLISQAQELTPKRAPRIRTLVAGWLVRAGLWLDPRIEDGIGGEHTGIPNEA